MLHRRTQSRGHSLFPIDDSRALLDGRLVKIERGSDTLVFDSKWWSWVWKLVAWRKLQGKVLGRARSTGWFYEVRGERRMFALILFLISVMYSDYAIFRLRHLQIHGSKTLRRLEGQGLELQSFVNKSSSSWYRAPLGRGRASCGCPCNWP